MAQVRDAGVSPSDADFIVAAFDSTLPFLASSGNGGQWGAVPFSERDGFVQETHNDVARSREFQSGGQGERKRLFIAEVLEDDAQAGAQDNLHRRTKDNSGSLLSVGAIMILDNDFPPHILEMESLKSFVQENLASPRFVFVDVLISDHRVKPAQRKGAGRVLVEHVKEYARKNGKKAVFLDCWMGGTGNLLKYYESLGFRQVQDIEVKRQNGSVWPSRLFRMNVGDGH